MYRSYSHIDLDERRKIARWRMAGLGVGIIVEKLGRHRSTIFREIKRNIFIDKECHPPPGPPRSARRLRPLRDTPTRRVDGRKLGRRLVAPVSSSAGTGFPNRIPPRRRPGMPFRAIC